MQANNKSTILFIISIVAVILLGYLRFCGSEKIKDPQKEIIIKTDTVTITTVDTNSYKLFWENLNQKQYITVVESIPQIVDTFSILHDYYTRKTFVDSFQDTNVLFSTEIDVFKNSIVGFRPSYKILRPDISTIITNEITKLEPKRNQIFFGLGSTFSTEKQSKLNLNLYPNAIFVDKKKRMYQLGIDPFNKRLLVNFGYSPW